MQRGFLGDMLLQVALIGSSSNFESGSGQGVDVYSNILVSKAAYNKHIKMVKEEVRTSMPMQADSLSIYLFSLFHNMDNYDILHILYTYPFVQPFNKHSVIVTTAHDFVPVLYPELAVFKEGAFKNLGWLALNRFGIYTSLHSSKYLLANSVQTAKEAVLLGFKKQNVIVVSHAISERILKEPIHRKKSNRFTVGYLGGMIKRKNVMFAIEALKKVDGKMTAEIWGKKEMEYERLREAAKEDRRIRFMGFADEAKKAAIYDSFDVFLFPSLHEGFGLPIIEAQARGVPVIIYKKAKISKEVRKYCLEAESPEHMARIIEEIRANGYSERKRKEAMEYARKFTPEAMAANTIKAYYTIAKREFG